MFYLGSAFSLSMLNLKEGNEKMYTANSVIDESQVQRILRDKDVKICLNPLHINTNSYLKKRFNISVPEKANFIQLKPGDCLVTYQIKNIIRENRELTDEEFLNCESSFILTNIISPNLFESEYEAIAVKSEII